VVVEAAISYSPSQAVFKTGFCNEESLVKVGTTFAATEAERKPFSLSFEVTTFAETDESSSLNVIRDNLKPDLRGLATATR
jgi:hypothetical protein